MTALTTAPHEHLESVAAEIARAAPSLEASISRAAESLPNLLASFSRQAAAAFNVEPLIHSLADALSGGRVVEVRREFDELYGEVVTVAVDLPAREAFDLWLKLIRAAKEAGLRELVAVEWRGENNLSEEELADYIARVMLESGHGPRALPGFNAVEAVREVRGG